MEYAESLQNIIQEISQKFQFDLTKVGAQYQLEYSTGFPLIIEVPYSYQIDISCRWASPHLIKVEVFTGERFWVPMSVKTSDGYSHISALIDRKEQSVDIIAPQGYKELNRACRFYARFFQDYYLNNENEQPKIIVSFNESALLKAA